MILMPFVLLGIVLRASLKRNWIDLWQVTTGSLFFLSPMQKILRGMDRIILLLCFLLRVCWTMGKVDIEMGQPFSL